jgi:hypothetical protein
LRAREPGAERGRVEAATEAAEAGVARAVDRRGVGREDRGEAAADHTAEAGSVPAEVGVAEVRVEEAAVIRGRAKSRRLMLTRVLHFARFPSRWCVRFRCDGPV